jgi:phosphate transport system permease protein
VIEPEAKPRRLIVPRKGSFAVRAVDFIAGLFIRIGGIGIILVVAGIFVFLLLQIIPLFQGAKVTQSTVGSIPVPSPSDATVLGGDEYETYMYSFEPASGEIVFRSLENMREDHRLKVDDLAGRKVACAYRLPANDQIVFGTEDGAVVTARVKFRPDYATGKRVMVPSIEKGYIVKTGSNAIGLVHARADSSGNLQIAVATSEKEFYRVPISFDLLIYAAEAEREWVDGLPVIPEPTPDIGEAPVAERIGSALENSVSCIAIDYDGDKFFVADDKGKLFHWNLSNDKEKLFAVYDMGPTRSVTAMDFVIGDAALVLGLRDGSNEFWFGVREREVDAYKPMRKIYEFEAMPGTVTSIVPSGQNKGFLVGSADGTIQLKFTTSRRTLATYKLDHQVQQLAYTPKLTGIIALTNEGTVDFKKVDNPHPETSFRSLFMPVHYEGYDKPDFVWQSTGGTDNFETKLSLIPLIVGTLKGAFYGLLFAVPVALLAALYTSQFMPFGLRAVVKPTVEIMAALPSVVIGFLAGLWLAPVLETRLTGTLIALPAVAILVLFTSIAWNYLPNGIRRCVPQGWEIIYILPVVLLGFVACQWLGPHIEAALFGGDLRQWVYDTFKQKFEQRNSIVIGFAMAFAVIPIIFTISEDSFSNVPAHFRSASYALGASRWQTAWRVIFPTASPGVFSAVMIGFGRAVGETMIVLMATGNTPLLSLSPFNGMRTLSANIAVEIPEAPVGGTHYRVLFLSALLLFGMTFIVNTFAEMIRHRLRQRYRAV